MGESVDLVLSPSLDADSQEITILIPSARLEIDDGKNRGCLHITWLNGGGDYDMVAVSDSICHGQH